MRSNRNDLGHPAMQDDAAYYRTRTQEEIGAATTARTTASRKAHLELAQRYQELADALDKRDRDSGIKRAPEQTPSIA